MQHTTHYELNKPDGTDYAKIACLNENADKIDTALKALSDALGGIDLTTLSNAITAVDNKVTEHLEDKAQHNQFIHEGKLHQIGFGYNPTLSCFTFSIREVI